MLQFVNNLRWNDRISFLNRIPVFMTLICAFIIIGALFFAPARAQDQCGVVTTMSFPVDRSVFHIAQDFGVPSPRHQGRYHTGEDYSAGRGGGLGQPVRAIADGRVTYSAPTGWGRDGGVVIVEHTFPDGTVAYSQYGHMMETESYLFPARFTCVKAGDVVGAVGNARPAPHLHFEIRTNQPDVPGPGYTSEIPTALGWRVPSQFVVNWGTWLSPAHLWHVETPGRLLVPPFDIPGQGMLLLDATRLRFATPDGRVLWRINLDRPALGLTSADGLPLLMYPDGLMQIINLDGTVGEIRELGFALDGRPIPAGDLLLLHTPDNTLVALGADRLTPVWQLADVPPLKQAFAAPTLLGLVTQGDEILSVGYDGALLDRAQLTGPASLSAAVGGGLLAYTQGGLWRVDSTGTWALALETAPAPGETGAALDAGDGRMFTLNQTTDTNALLSAYDLNGAVLWNAELADVSGAASLARYGDVLLLTTTHGNIVAARLDGGLCSTARIYGDGRSLVWHSLDADGTLRVMLGDQVLGLNWSEFLGACG